MGHVRPALIGYGLAGRVIHRPLLTSVDALQLTHVVTSDPVRRSEAAADLPTASVLTDVDELWSCADEFDAVVVATSNDAHVDLATRALELRKAVVVDKPLAPTCAEAATLVRRARSLGVPLTVFHNRRWDSDTLTAQELLASGRLGTVYRMESRFTRFRPHVADRWRERPGSGGILLDLGTHLVDQALHLLGPVESVYAEIATRRPGAVVDDDCLLVLTHVSGTSSVLWCSATAPWTGPRLVLQGSRAGWVKQDLDGQEAAQRCGTVVQAEPDGLLWNTLGAKPVLSRTGDWAAFYRRFAGAVLDGGPLPVDPYDAVTVLSVLEAARLSADHGQVVPVQPLA